MPGGCRRGWFRGQLFWLARCSSWCRHRLRGWPDPSIPLIQPKCFPLLRLNKLTTPPWKRSLPAIRVMSIRWRQPSRSVGLLASWSAARSAVSQVQFLPVGMPLSSRCPFVNQAGPGIAAPALLHAHIQNMFKVLAHAFPSNPRSPLGCPLRSFTRVNLHRLADC